ncbi:MAG: cell division protein SepF [Firmicutes bacterium]|nr:cell division protein SepF [Bacillota bacterium]
MSFNDWLRGGRNQRGAPQGEENVEYYEDTHDEHGNYTGKQSQTAGRPRIFSPEPSVTPAAAPGSGGKASFGNIVVYRPSTPEEVETLINFLKKGESAVVNLDDLKDADAQRILDFLSGAIYALSGNIHRVKDNIFLLSPSGVEIQSY